VPVLFVGKSGVGKTKLARELCRLGIPAYAPEDIAVIQLGIEKLFNGVENAIASKNDRGYPLLMEGAKLVRLV
jgi:serine kinase of HPr protein (carbohydrate metabolism regulator)